MMKAPMNHQRVGGILLIISLNTILGISMMAFTLFINLLLMAYFESKVKQEQAANYDYMVSPKKYRPRDCSIKYLRTL
jgi:hypothetical protein